MDNAYPDILVINGSLRAGGNTDTIIARVIGGIEESGLSARLVNLRDKRIDNCDGCWRCMTEDSCAINDDMNGIYKAVENSKLMLFASPMYWCGVTGIMKTFLDRLFFYYHPHTKKLIAGKRAVIVTTMNQKDEPSETKIIAATYKIVFRCIGIETGDMHFFTGLLEKDAALKNPDSLGRAYNIGKKLYNSRN